MICKSCRRLITNHKSPITNLPLLATSLLSLSRSSQNPAHLLGRHLQPFGPALDFLFFSLPHTGNYDFSEIFGQFLKRFIAGEACPRGPYLAPKTPARHHPLLQHLSTFPP